MPIKKSKITILGAGPSGLSAAIYLAQNDFTVTVCEQREYPGARFKNAWQILENYSSNIDALEELQLMGLQPFFFYSPQRSVRFFDSKLREFHLTSKKPFGYFIKRGGAVDSLDSALFRMAQQSGVQFKFLTRINPNDADIIAGGSTYISGVSKEIVFESPTNDLVLTILDNYLTPFGFSYLFIINGHGTIGTAILRDFKYIDIYAETVVLRFKQIVDFTMNNIQETVSSVDFFIPKTAVENSKLFVGEAAGFQDYLFGLNIRRSIQSGYLAAKSIVEGLSYDDFWKKHFITQMKNSILNRFIYEQCGNAGYTFFLCAARHFDFRNTGYFLNNPGLIRRTAACFVKTLWENHKSCKHNNRCEWCRTIC